MLGQFVPLGVREPQFEDPVEGTTSPQIAGLMRPGITAALGLTVGTTLVVAVLDAMQAMRGTPPAAFDVSAALWRISHPADVGGWLQIVGILSFAIVGGMFVAATRVRRAR